MKASVLLVMLVVSVGFVSGCGRIGNEDRISLIPRPVKMEMRMGSFEITRNTVIYSTGRRTQAREVGEFLAGMINRVTDFDLAVEGTDAEASPEGSIFLCDKAQEVRLGEEGYTLEVKRNGIVIRANTRAGLFYGVVSLVKLMPNEVISARRVKGSVIETPCVKIEDYPRFRWRGLLIDCSRTFWRKDYLKRYVDLLSYYKMNVLHLHLTDDQGWRVEIKSHPKLTRLCSTFAPRFNEPAKRSGFYTQEDIKEIVAYAAARHITIVPEIEMPAHCSAVFAAYPELSCEGRKKKEICPWHGDRRRTRAVFCAGNDEVFKFLGEVLAEIAELFPSRFIHVGGDECRKDLWRKCPKCQKRIREEGLANEEELQSYFIKRIEKVVAAQGRTLIGWDEILEGGLAPQAAVMSWRGMQGGIKAARAGHDVVMSPRSHCYFDYGHRRFPLKNVYSFEPIPAELTPDEGKSILGAQANMWTHLARTEAGVDSQIWPRLLALAEVVWSPKASRDWPDFERRVEREYERLDMLDVNFYKRGHWKTDFFEARVVRVDSEHHVFPAHYAIDDDPFSFWHTPWEAGDPKHPHGIQIDCGRERTIRGITYVPRQDRSTGRVAAYEVFVSRDGKSWGRPAAKGRFARGAERVDILFERPRTMRYFHFVSHSGFDNQHYTAVGELGIIPE